MSKISDELREFIDEGDLYPSYIDELMRIADRIDAEMAELPRSADGKSWTGREVCFWTGAEREEYHSFHDLVLRPEGWYVEDDCGNRYMAESVWYERPDSLERIADELDEMVDAAQSADDGCEKLAELAARIRRLMEREDGNE